MLRYHPCSNSLKEVNKTQSAKPFVQQKRVLHRQILDPRCLLQGNPNSVSLCPHCLIRLFRISIIHNKPRTISSPVFYSIIKDDNSDVLSHSCMPSQRRFSCFLSDKNVQIPQSPNVFDCLYEVGHKGVWRSFDRSI